MSLPPLNALRAFEASARLNSFKRASEELFVTPSAISQQIKTLEDHLGVILFERTSHGIHITQAGKKLLPALERAFSDISTAVQLLSDEKRAVIRISAPPAFSSSWLGPRLQEFEETFPDFATSLHSSLDKVDFREEGFDCSIRVYFDEDKVDIKRVQVDEELRGQFMFETELLCTYNPNLLVNKEGKLDLPKNHLDLDRFNLLHFRDYTSWTMAARYQEMDDVDTSAGIIFRSTSSLLAAVAAGQGLALLDNNLFNDKKFGKTFTKLPSPQGPYKMAFFFIAPQSHWQDEKIQILRDWLFDHVERMKGHYAYSDDEDYQASY